MGSSVKWLPVTSYRINMPFFRIPLNKDQMEDYAKRSGKTLEEAERWLSPIRRY